MDRSNQMEIPEKTFPIRISGSWPPGISALSGLGFDSVSVSRAVVLIKKTQSAGMTGRPHLFCEISLGKTSCTLSYSVPKESYASLRRLQASLLLLRVLSLLPHAEISAQELAQLLIPPLESAAAIASFDYELLSKKHGDLRRHASELSSKNSRLSASSEESAALILEQSRTIAALGARIKKLETVSDSALAELVMEWVSSHRGSFNSTAFASANWVSASRAEEGLERLLQSGELRKIGGSFSPQAQGSRAQYVRQEKGLLARIGERAGRFASGAHLPLPSKKEI